MRWERGCFIVFIIYGSTILFSKHGKTKRWKRLLLVLNVTKLTTTENKEI